MARRTIRERVSAGMQTVLGRLASFFRMGQAAAVPAGIEPQPGRERLETPQEIVATLSARHELPPAEPARRKSYSYLCIWTDERTGARIGATRVQIEADESTPRSTIYSRARRESRLDMGRYISAEILESATIRMSCTKLSETNLY